MRLSDILSICCRNLTRRKLRTFLTALGIVIGVALIIIAVSIGIGLQQAFDKQLAGWGDLTMITVNNYSSKSVLDDAAVAKMQALEGVDIATPFYQNWDANFQVKTKDGRYTAYPELYGVYPEALEKMGYTLKEGSFLKVGDKEYSVVVGELFAYRFQDTRKKRNNRVDPYPDANGVIKNPYVNVRKDKMILYIPPQKFDSNGKPIGKQLEVTLAVSGVLEKSDSNWEATNSVFMDLNEMKALIAKNNKLNGSKKTVQTNYQQVKVKCVDVESVAAIQAAIKEQGFECYSMNDSRESMQQTAQMIQLVLGGLAGFSLLVAAIGIANTMFMSIYERTREIGVMKVIGAELSNIRTMFLVESGMIGFLGGAMGVILSYIGSFLFNNLAGGLMGGMVGGGDGSKLSIIPLWLVGFALVFSVIIGVIFGFLPANRAVKISALEAIKHD